MALAASVVSCLPSGTTFRCALANFAVDIEGISRLLTAVMAVLGAVLVALGALSSEETTIGLGLAAALAGGVLFRASGWFWDWYWDWLERLQSGEIEPTAALRAFLVVSFVAVGAGGFVGLWWTAAFGGVVSDGALAENPISIATVAGGVVPGVVLGGGFFVVAWMLRSRNASLDVTKGSRGFQVLFASTLCTLGAYCLLLVLHPPSAVALAVAYLMSFVVSAAVYASRTSEF